MREYDLLVFDWDGTLCDSISLIVASVQGAAQACGVPPCSAEAVKAIIGLSLDDAIRTLYPGAVGETFVARFHERYSSAYVAADAVPSPLFDGVRQALEGFGAAGYRLAVATGKSRRGLDRVLGQHGLQGVFEVTRCADEAAGKPDPRMLWEILAHCAVPPERALMIGDSPIDLEMARRAGVDAIGVTYGAQSREQLMAGGALAILDDFAELAPWLGRGFRPAGVSGHDG